MPEKVFSMMMTHGGLKVDPPYPFINEICLLVMTNVNLAADL